MRKWGAFEPAPNSTLRSIYSVENFSFNTLRLTSFVDPDEPSAYIMWDPPVKSASETATTDLMIHPGFVTYILTYKH